MAQNKFVDVPDPGQPPDPGAEAGGASGGSAVGALTELLNAVQNHGADIADKVGNAVVAVGQWLKGLFGRRTAGQAPNPAAAGKLEEDRAKLNEVRDALRARCSSGYAATPDAARMATTAGMSWGTMTALINALLNLLDAVVPAAHGGPVGPGGAPLGQAQPFGTNPPYTPPYGQQQGDPSTGLPPNQFAPGGRPGSTPGTPTTPPGPPVPGTTGAASNPSLNPPHTEAGKKGDASETEKGKR